MVTEATTNLAGIRERLQTARQRLERAEARLPTPMVVGALADSALATELREAFLEVRSLFLAELEAQQILAPTSNKGN